MKKRKECKTQQNTSKKDQKASAVMFANAYTNSVTNSALTIETIYNNNSDIVTIKKKLDSQIEKINKGDISEIEEILMTQAQTLNNLFHLMTRQLHTAGLLPQLQVYMEIALKAQNQSRKTLVAIAELKNPKRTTFIKQQNNAVNQQVNNKVQTQNSKKINKTANKLLSEKEHETLDTGRTYQAIRINPAMETVGTINRTSHAGR